MKTGLLQPVLLLAVCSALLTSAAGAAPATLSPRPVLFERYSIDDLPKLRRGAERGRAKAQLLLYHAYRRSERHGEPPWISTEKLASRAEAVSALRAAAEQGHEPAERILAYSLLFGDGVKQDPREALAWLEKVEPGDGEAASFAYLKAHALTALAELGEAERLRAIELAEDALAGGHDIAIRPKAAAIALADPAAARVLLEESFETNAMAVLPLARMLIAGTGGPADTGRASELLEQADTDAGRVERGRQHLDGGIMPRMPRRAIALMADYALTDQQTRQQVAELLVTYRVKLAQEDVLHFKMLEDADIDYPGAVLNVLRLHKVHREGFRSEKAWFDLLRRYARSDPEIAVLDVGRLARFALFAKGASKQMFTDQVRTLIADLEAKAVPGVFAVHADLLMRGVVFPQDSVRAVALLERGAELGDPAAMIALADALESGAGVARDRARAIALLKQAASEGSFAARGQLVGRFRFISQAEGITPADGITNKIAMYGDGMEHLGAMGMRTFFVGAEMSGLAPAEILAPFYDGFRISPAAAEDDLLVPLIRNTPDWIWRATEQILVHNKYWQGEPAGHMGPEARAAFRRFIADAGRYSYQ